MKLIARIYDMGFKHTYLAEYEYASAKMFQQQRYYPLNWLCIYGYYHVIRDLLSSSDMCDINIMSSSPLRFAVTYGHENIVELLLSHGANVNAHNGDPVRIACEYGFDNILKLLIKYGARPTNDDMCRAVWLGQFDCVCLLIQHYGLDPMRHRCRALRYALQRGHFQIHDYLRSCIDYPITIYQSDGSSQSISSSLSHSSSSDRTISSSSPEHA